jgi:two-component system OmpR family sensor kinase
VSALVTAHGGTVTVAPTPGGGATFRINLPLAPEVVDHDVPPADDPGADGPGAGAVTEPGPADPATAS